MPLLANSQCRLLDSAPLNPQELEVLACGNFAESSLACPNCSLASESWSHDGASPSKRGLITGLPQQTRLPSTRTPHVCSSPTLTD